MSIEWGIYLMTAQLPETTAREAVANSTSYAVEAERLGFSHAWVLEHHFTRYGIAGSALMHASFILGRTRTLKVGTAIQVIPLQHPVRVAEEVALIDQMSEGRLLFGIGRGIFVKDYRVFGADIKRNREMMTDWYDVLIRAWTQGKCSGAGDFLDFPEVDIHPEVFTKPHPPIYTVAQSPESIAWAAQRGMPMLLDFTLPDEDKASRLEHYALVADEAGFDPDSIPHVISFLAGADRDGDRIRANSEKNLIWWFEEFNRASAMFTPGAERIAGYEWHIKEFEQLAIRGERDVKSALPRVFDVNPIGTPQECIDKLSRTVEITGVRNFALGFESVGKRELVLESMNLFAEEVMPYVQ